jgi:competence protein ComEA
MPEDDKFDRGRSVGAQDRVNINSASREELARVYRIGDDLADRIARYREEHRPFQRPEDLEKVPGIAPDLVRHDAAGQITV